MKIISTNKNQYVLTLLARQIKTLICPKIVFILSIILLSAIQTTAQEEKDVYSILKNFIYKSEYYDYRLLITPVNSEVTKLNLQIVSKEKGSGLTPQGDISSTTKPDTIISLSDWHELLQNLNNIQSINKWDKKLLARESIAFKRKKKKESSSLFSFLKKTNKYSSLKFNYLKASYPYFWNSSKAIIYIEQQSSPESGSGDIYILEKNKDCKWRIIATSNIWIS